MTTLTNIIGSEKGNEGRDNSNSNNNINPIDLAKEVTKRLRAEARRDTLKEKKKAKENTADTASSIENIFSTSDSPNKYYAPLERRPNLIVFRYPEDDFDQRFLNSLNPFEERLFHYVSNTTICDHNRKYEYTVSEQLFYFYIFRSMIETEKAVLPALIDFKDDFFRYNPNIKCDDSVLGINPEYYTVEQFKFILEQLLHNPMSNANFNPLFGKTGLFQKRYDEELAKINTNSDSHYKIITLPPGKYTSSECFGLVPEVTSTENNKFIELKFDKYYEPIPF